MKEKQPTMVRINTRVSPEQQKFIKDLAKKLGCGEGELHRSIIAYYIKHYKK